MTGRRRDAWTEEEDFFLLEIFRSPGLEKLWNQKARKEGWKSRTHKALKARIKFLGESLRYADESCGWITANQLGLFLSLGEIHQRIWRWQRMGLVVYRDGDTLSSPLKIHLHDFVNWAMNNGRAEITHSIRGDEAAMNWLLRQIADWKDYKVVKPHGGHHPQAERMRVHREEHDAAV